MLLSLEIRDVRNICKATVKPANKINVIIGKNGCGKTAFLEAIFLLGRGRSFRTPRIREIINYNSENFIISGEIECDGKNINRVGIKTKEKKIEIKINGEKKNNRTELVKNLPTQIIYPGSFCLLEEGPENRRKFLDYGLFHMEHSSVDNWKRYNRSLKQRNALIRTSRQSNQTPWRLEMVKYGNLLNEQRENYFRGFEIFFLETVSSFLPFNTYEFSFYRGWALGKSLAQILVENEQSDLILGFTKNGPHRADFKIKVDGKDAKRNLSRGQMKLLVFAIKIAQVRMANNFSSNPHCILIDDLASELDMDNKKIIIDYLRNLKTQIFITATDAQVLGQELSEEKVFHVEQGCFFSS